MLSDYLPLTVNAGPWITAYTLPELQRMSDVDFVLPICSFSTPYRQCAQLGTIVLPPLYHEALDDDLKQAIIARIQLCFPRFRGERVGGPVDRSQDSCRLRVVELPRQPLPVSKPSMSLAFSVDTAVEEHGPHLPLGTDTIQSYSVLNRLAEEFSQLELCRPVDYGQLTWGLPFGFSVDLTAELLSRYVTRYVNALVNWKRPESIYVVDVHGSIIHREAIVAGLEASDFARWTFRWLHEPLAPFASARGDQHAGGVETTLVQRVSPELVDPSWWPDRIDEIAARQMSFQRAVDLAPTLETFAQEVQENSLNGVIGDIRNYHAIDADELFERMMVVARSDVDQLLRGVDSQSAGKNLW